MVDGSTVRKNGEGEDSSVRLVLLFLKVSCTVSGVCQICSILVTHWLVWVSLIESEGLKNNL